MYRGPVMEGGARGRPFPVGTGGVYPSRLSIPDDLGGRECGWVGGPRAPADFTLAASGWLGSPTGLPPLAVRLTSAILPIHLTKLFSFSSPTRLT
jgi:hypothetical protein